MSTYQDLIDDAAAILRGPDIAALLLIYARQAIRDVQKNPISPIYEGALSFNVAVAASALEGTIAAGDNFGRAISVKFSGEQLPLDERHPRSFFEAGYPDNDDDFADEPTEFAIYGSKILFNGLFADAKTCVIRHAPWVAAPTLATETFPYSEKLYDVVVSRMLILGFIDQRDDVGKSDWEKIYLQRLNDYFGVASRLSDASKVSKTMTTGR